MRVEWAMATVIKREKVHGNTRMMDEVAVCVDRIIGSPVQHPDYSHSIEAGGFTLWKIELCKKTINLSLFTVEWECMGVDWE